MALSISKRPFKRPNLPVIKLGILSRLEAPLTIPPIAAPDAILHLLASLSALLYSSRILLIFSISKSN